MANEIDELMDLDPLAMSARNIDDIIAYHRQNRANAEAGIKPKKETGPKVSLSGVLDGLLANKPKAPVASGVKRRV